MNWKVSLAAAAVLALGGVAAQAGVDAYKLDPSFIKGKQSIHAHGAVSPALAAKNAAAAEVLRKALSNARRGQGLPGIDSVVNFLGSFTAADVDATGKNPQSNWNYAMVGNAPSLGGTTTIDAPVIPITMQLLDANGNQAFDPATGAALIVSAQNHLQPVLQSPVFDTAFYVSSNEDTQFTDAFHRTAFYNQMDQSWHTMLDADPKPGLTMHVPFGKYFYALNGDGSCCLFVLVDFNEFGSLIFPPGVPDNTTLMGAAEVSGEATTQSITTLLFPDVYLYQNGDPNQCCTLGYHTFDVEPGTAQNGNLPRFYMTIYASWMTRGLFQAGDEDITALSHEMAETFDDPFVVFDGVHNLSPWWSSGNPNGFFQCQDDIEVGDVIEVLASAESFGIAMKNHMVYHPQNVALLQWFEEQNPSTAFAGAYSFPDPATLQALSPVTRPVFDANGNLIACTQTARQ